MISSPMLNKSYPQSTITMVGGKWIRILAHLFSHHYCKSAYTVHNANARGNTSQCVLMWLEKVKTYTETVHRFFPLRNLEKIPTHITTIIFLGQGIWLLKQGILGQFRTFQSIFRARKVLYLRAGSIFPSLFTHLASFWVHTSKLYNFLCIDFPINMTFRSFIFHTKHDIGCIVTLKWSVRKLLCQKHSDFCCDDKAS